MPLDYWNQFISSDEENLRSPPFNPATHLKDGTPITPECTPGELRKVFLHWVPLLNEDRRLCRFIRIVAMA